MVEVAALLQDLERKIRPTDMRASYDTLFAKVKGVFNDDVVALRDKMRVHFEGL